MNSIRIFLFILFAHAAQASTCFDNTDLINQADKLALEIVQLRDRYIETGDEAIGFYCTDLVNDALHELYVATGILKLESRIKKRHTKLVLSYLHKTDGWLNEAKNTDCPHSKRLTHVIISNTQLITNVLSRT